MDEFRSSKRIRQETWLVRRYGFIEEVEDWDGSLKYRVVVQDQGRAPFVNRLFRRPDSAEEFYLKLINETALPPSIEKIAE